MSDFFDVSLHWKSNAYSQMAKITVQNTPITVLNIEEHDYISLTDMATAKDGDSRAADVIKNWIRNRYTIEFLGTWEVIHNPDFKVVEFDHFRMSAGLPSFLAPVSTKNLNESEPFTNAVTYIRLSPGITKGIVPVGVSFTIRAFVQTVQRIMVPSNK